MRQNSTRDSFPNLSKLQTLNKNQLLGATRLRFGHASLSIAPIRQLEKIK